MSTKVLSTLIGPFINMLAVAPEIMTVIANITESLPRPDTSLNALAHLTFKRALWDWGTKELVLHFRLHFILFVFSLSYLESSPIIETDPSSSHPIRSRCVPLEVHLGPCCCFFFFSAVAFKE